METVKHQVSFRKKLLAELGKLLFLLFLIWVLLFLVFGLKRMNGSSMEPDLKDGDVLFYYRLYSRYTQSDVVLYETQQGRRAGRIAAGPGDEIFFSTEGQLVINGYIQAVLEGTDVYLLPEQGPGDPLTLKAGQYFILNEDKENLEDSRTFGVIEKKDIKGKIITVWRRRSI